ncbi:MAG: EamA family transporter, partial [Ignavibacteria bacterium]|nr:EamA family transporter [Ignavibacteria bacterium]
ISAILMQGIGFLAWMVVLTKMKLGVAFAFSGALFYILIAISSYYLYGENLSLQQWIGLILISIGVVLMNLAALQ